MNWDRMEGQWKQGRGKAVTHWGKMMDDELAAVAGKYEELVGRLQEKYGIAKEEARQQVNKFKMNAVELKKSNHELMKLQKTLSKKNSGKTSRIFKKPPRIRTRSKSNG
jgi:uncharacterized protein YjbJ (UPF0337 family)